MKKKTVTPLLGQVLKKIAPRIGATVVMEPMWNIVGQITFRNGRRRYFRYSSLDLNPLGASEVAKDKDYANFFMQRMGYPTIPGKTFFSRDWGKAIGMPNRGIDAAYRYAQDIGFPVIVKPNSGSQGSGVAIVHTKIELLRALNAVFRRDRVALVQQVVHGNDYRIVVLDDQIISAYQRVPLNVVGNGKSTIRALLRAKQRQFIAAHRDTRINVDDRRIATKLRRCGMSLKSVPANGERVFLLDNANLSTGGESVDVTKNIHPFFRRTAVQLVKDMGLRLCGVDLMINGDIQHRTGVYWVIEINSAPGLDHYAKTGKKQEEAVEAMYLKVLKSMAI